MVDPKIVEQVYKEYKKEINMTLFELKAWRDNPCSKKASSNRTPINRNISLLTKKKDKWTLREVNMAKKTISFLKRMKKIKSGKIICDGLSKRDIALKNWAYNPKKRI